MYTADNKNTCIPVEELEIGQGSDSPDSDSGSEIELESQHVRARGQFLNLRGNFHNYCT